MNQYTRPWPRVSLGLLLMMLLSGYLPAAEPVRTLNAAFLNFPPMAYYDENGDPTGSIIELTNRVAAESGLQINWVSYPIRRIYQGLITGKIDFWPGSQAIPALSEATIETPSIGVNITLCAFSLGTTPSIENVEDLARNELVLIRGYTYRAQLDDIFEQSLRRPIVAPDHRAAMQLLQKGRADYLISYADPIEKALLHYPQADSKCDVLDTWPLVYVVSKNIPDAEGIAAALTEGYRRLSAARSEPVPFALAR